MSSEDKLFDILRRVPFEEIINEYLTNLNEWDIDTRVRYIYSKGWTIDEFNERWLQDLAP